MGRLRLVEQPLGFLEARRFARPAADWRRCASRKRRSRWRAPMPSRSASASMPRAVERAGADHAHGAVHGRARSLPGRREGRGLRPAAQAGAEARGFGGGRRRIEGDVPRLGRAHRANRAAIDARRPHAGEETAIVTTITTAARALAFAMIEHGDGVRIRRARFHASWYPRRHGNQHFCQAARPQRRMGRVRRRRIRLGTGVLWSARLLAGAAREAWLVDLADLLGDHGALSRGRSAGCQFAEQPTVASASHASRWPAPYSPAWAPWPGRTLPSHGISCRRCC